LRGKTHEKDARCGGFPPHPCRIFRGDGNDALVWHTDGDGQEQTGSNNECTAVVFDFRGFDTLGESTVLFCAIIGVALMFRKMQGGEEYEDE
jgi:multisubunit Na+/H+ antiporter MnhB subunit